MADTLDTTRRDRLAEAREVFEAMWRCLDEVIADDDIRGVMSRNLADQIRAALERSGKVSF